MRRGLVPSRGVAADAISRGLVTVDGAPAVKAAMMVAAAQQLVVETPPRRFVSRGGDKLAHALDHFAIDVGGRHCLDAGVSTGGFTDCLLQAGAATVVAVDVGYGQVHDRLRQDPRVDIRERTNVRALTRDHIAEPAPTLLVADLSFISLALVLGGLLGLLADDPASEAVVLVKPQFESEREHVGSGGVVRDPQAWRSSIERVARAADQTGWCVGGVTRSPLRGPAGNVEFLLHIVRPAAKGGDTTSTSRSSDRLAEQIDAVVGAHGADAAPASAPASRGEHPQAGEGSAR